jgi:hypothetical protein
MRLREYAIAISTSPVFVATLPMPLLCWAIRHLKSNILIASVITLKPAIHYQFKTGQREALPHFW